MTTTGDLIAANEEFLRADRQLADAERAVSNAWGEGRGEQKLVETLRRAREEYAHRKRMIALTLSLIKVERAKREETARGHD